MKKYCIVLSCMDWGDPAFFYFDADGEIDSESFKAKLYQEIYRWHDGQGGIWLSNLNPEDLVDNAFLTIFEVGQSIPSTGLLVDAKRRCDIDDSESAARHAAQREKDELRELQRLQAKFKK